MYLFFFFLLVEGAILIAIENIVSLAAAGNIIINQSMEREAAVVVTVKIASVEEPKWTTMMAKNVRHVGSQAMETLVDTPKQKEGKFNLRLTCFEAKEGETEKELVQRFNTELLQGQMRLRAKVVATTWQRTAIAWASTSTASVRPSAVLFKFATNKDRQAVL